jgi:hypothetical protein
MSDVISFRLSDKNQRETQAKGVLEAWVKKGYSFRHIMTEALLLLGNHDDGSINIYGVTETIDRLNRLIEKFEGFPEIFQAGQPVKSELSDVFISSIKSSFRPGLQIESS